MLPLLNTNIVKIHNERNIKSNYHNQSALMIRVKQPPLKQRIAVVTQLNR